MTQFSIVVPVVGIPNTTKIREALLTYADNLGGEINTGGPTSSVVALREKEALEPKSVAQAKEAAPTKQAEAPKAEAPAKEKAAPKAKAPAKKELKPPPTEAEVADAVNDEDLDLGFDLDDEDAAEEVELTLGDHVMPAFKKFLAARIAKSNKETAIKEVAELLRSKFGVKSGRVADLPKAHYAAALEAIK